MDGIRESPLETLWDGLLDRLGDDGVSGRVRDVGVGVGVGVVDLGVSGTLPRPVDGLRMKRSRALNGL